MDTVRLSPAAQPGRLPGSAGGELALARIVRMPAIAMARMGDPPDQPPLTSSYSRGWLFDYANSVRDTESSCPESMSPRSSMMLSMALAQNTSVAQPWLVLRHVAM